MPVKLLRQNSSTGRRPRPGGGRRPPPVEKDYAGACGTPRLVGASGGLTLFDVCDTSRISVIPSSRARRQPTALISWTLFGERLFGDRGASQHLRLRIRRSGRREVCAVGALFSELGVMRGRLLCEAVRLSACRSLQMPGGQNSPSTIRRRSTLRHRAEAWCGGGTGRKQDVAAFTVALGCWGNGGSVGQHVRVERIG